HYPASGHQALECARGGRPGARREGWPRTAVGIRARAAERGPSLAGSDRPAMGPSIGQTQGGGRELNAKYPGLFGASNTGKLLYNPRALSIRFAWDPSVVRKI